MATPFEQLKREALAGLESLDATLAKLASEPLLAPEQDPEADDEDEAATGFQRVETSDLKLGDLLFIGEADDEADADQIVRAA